MSMHDSTLDNTILNNTLTYPQNGDQLCKDVFGFAPKSEQRQVAEHIGRGEDCILVAGCGWGKTLAYFLPLILWKTRVIVIISPLVALMDEQHEKLSAVNISSIPIHGGRKAPDDIEERLMNGRYSAVFMSPETAFGSQFKSIWDEEAWRSRVQAIVIDEAHCICTWGPDFRKDYSRIGELRSRIPPGVAFVAVSATLHDQYIEDVRNSLHYSNNVTIIKANTDRHNVKYDVRVCTDVESCHQHLEYLLDFKKTIVYFDSKKDMLQVYKHLMKAHSVLMGKAQAPQYQSEKIATYHAGLKPGSKTLYMSKFRRGDIRILLSTEAAGMGCDISDIDRVVQFKFPDNISSLAQRLGRAARDPRLQGYGTLIYPRTDNSRMKTLEADVYKFITGDTNCRRQHLNRVFKNEHKEISNCCDLCDKSPPTTNKPDHRRILKGPRPAPKFKRSRRPEQQLVAKDKIKAWRNMELQELEKQSEIYIADCIMDDSAINLLSARFGEVSVVEDISLILDWSELIDGSQRRLAEVLINYNNDIDRPDSVNVVDKEQARPLTSIIEQEEDPSNSVSSQHRRQTQKRVGEDNSVDSGNKRSKS